MRRIVFEQLHAWGEWWTDMSASAEFAEWEQLLKSYGRDTDEFEIQYYITEGLLEGVVYAAGGVERELERVEQAMEEAQRWTDEARATYPSQPGVSQHFGAPSLVDASYAFINLLWWARAVRERVKRPHRPGSKELVGLLPTLAPGPLRDEVAAATVELDSALAGLRELANHALHAGSLGRGTPSADLLDDGQIFVRAPDLPSGRIANWAAVTFKEGREQLSYGRTVMDAVELFVDRLLDSFVEHVPDRVRGAAGEAGTAAGQSAETA
jgi:hypothetical protein